MEQVFSCDDGRSPTLATVFVTDDDLHNPAWLMSEGLYVDGETRFTERVECEEGVARPYVTSSARFEWADAKGME